MKKKKVDPEIKQTIADLEELAEKLGYKIRYEKGNFRGGYCILKESRLMVVNSRNEHDKRIAIISKSLKEIGIDDVYVKPGLREIIEKESKRKVAAEDVEEQLSSEETS
jgi:dTDP-D-glucose 4,6-dehydratase